VGVDEPMSPDFLAGIIEHVAHPIFVKDREFRFVLVNRALCEMLGYSPEQMLGKTDYDFFPAAEADFFRAKDAEMFSAGVTVTIEQEPITDSNGRLHILSTSKVPYRDATGAVTHMVGIINDITRLKQAEEALRQVNEELERRVAERTAALARAQEALVRRERLAAMGQLAGGLAHQLRNPLGAIANAAAVLRRAELTEPQRLALEAVQEEVSRADRTIRDLLDYARVRPPDRTTVTVLELIDGALEQERVPLSIAIEVDVPSDVAVMVDPPQVQSALGNVIRNAIEAMPGGGTLTLRARADGDRVLVAIGDTGGGVSEEQRTSLFDPLVTTKALGIGLGLSTARNLIENQGGSIRYCAPPDEGAEFMIELPRS
jgi:PAS domain S-box-containing protein